ncbi:MAG: hypothetical protein N3E51_00605 [Candidatus Micrarchaeota archaeon]|nr:hypothetical protein [Candidatus Micrarchaeota archaeon]
MGDEQLILFIERSRQRGRTDEQIMRALLSVGWKKERVEAALAMVSQKEGKKQAPAVPSVQQEAQKQQQAPKAEPQLRKQEEGGQPQEKNETQESQQSLQPAQAAQKAEGKPQESAKAQSEQATVPSQMQAESQRQPPAQPKPLWPYEKEGAQGDLLAAAYPKVSDEKEVKNPAFENLEKASKQKALPKLIPIALATLIILLGAAYFFLPASARGAPTAETPSISPPAQQPAALPAEHANASEKAKNSTQKQGQPVFPAKNQTAQQPPAQKEEREQPPPEKPSIPAPPPLPPPPETSPAPKEPPQNNTTAVQEQVHFNKSRSFQWDRGLTPRKFCRVNNMTFWRAHYSEFWGAQCVTEKNRRGNSTAEEFESRCTYLPCCFTAPSLEYSYYYDSFDCGYE